MGALVAKLAKTIPRPTLRTRRAYSSLMPHSRIEVQPAGRLGPSVEIARGGCDVAVAKGGLYFGQRGAAVDGMACVRMPEPVRTKVIIHSGSLRRTSKYYADATAIETPATA